MHIHEMQLWIYFPMEILYEFEKTGLTIEQEDGTSSWMRTSNRSVTIAIKSNTEIQDNGNGKNT